jgi:hypothetical protein
MKPAQDVPAGERAGLRIARRMASLAAQFVVALVIVFVLVALGSTWLAGGRLDLAALSPDRIRTVMAPPKSLVTREMSNGLYETSQGRPVFFVRGEVENRGDTASRVKVQVGLFDGEERVKSAEGYAGAVPTPEELYLLQGQEQASALRTRLDAAAAEVAPGARVPFIVIFPEYPEDIGDFRLEVTLEPQTGALGKK